MRAHVLLAACAVVTISAACNHDAGLTTGPRPASPLTSLETAIASVDFDVTLRAPDGGHGIGHVYFRQPPDDETVVRLGTVVHNLAPFTAYNLQRAADGPADGICTSTSWLTLGFGTVVAPIATDHRGTGRAELFRVLTNPVGSQFDIRFRIVDPSGAVVLTSPCYQFIVTK